MKTPDGAVACVCLVPELRLPHFASVEIQLYGGYEPSIGDKLIPAASLDALRAERDADRLRYLQMSHERDAILDQLQAAESKLADVGALADRWDADITDAGPFSKKDLRPGRFVNELRTLIAEAGTGEGGGA